MDKSYVLVAKRRDRFPRVIDPKDGQRKPSRPAPFSLYPLFHPSGSPGWEKLVGAR